MPSSHHPQIVHELVEDHALPDGFEWIVILCGDGRIIVAIKRSAARAEVFAEARQACRRVRAHGEAA